MSSSAASPQFPPGHDGEPSTLAAFPQARCGREIPTGLPFVDNSAGYAHVYTLYIHRRVGPGIQVQDGEREADFPYRTRVLGASRIFPKNLLTAWHSVVILSQTSDDTDPKGANLFGEKL
jgi:hypothetical protein